MRGTLPPSHTPRRRERHPTEAIADVHHYFLAPGNGLYWLRGLFFLLVVIALVVGTFFTVRLLLRRPPVTGAWSPYAGHPGQYPYSPHAAIEQLDARYARGEIDRTEYLQRRADLTGTPQGPAPPPPPA